MCEYTKKQKIEHVNTIEEQHKQIAMLSSLLSTWALRAEGDPHYRDVQAETVHLLDLVEWEGDLPLCERCAAIYGASATIPATEVVKGMFSPRRYLCAEHAAHALAHALARALRAQAVEV